MNTEQQWKVTIAPQEDFIIPKKLALLAQLENESGLEVLVEKGRITIVETQGFRHLVDQFIAETKEELRHLEPDDMWNDEMTVEAYLVLSESERDKLWEAGFAQAYTKIESEEEVEADADYIPAGQRNH